MSEGTFHEILALTGFGCTPASPEFLAWLAASKAPPEIIDLLGAGVPERQKRRRRLKDLWDFYTEREIRKDAEEHPRYLRSGLLPVGSCINGDPIALDIRKQIGAVGYISHDVVWEDEEARVRRFFVVVAPSLAEFARLAVDRAVPIDYWEAKRRN